MLLDDVMVMHKWRRRNYTLGQYVFEVNNFDIKPLVGIGSKTAPSHRRSGSLGPQVYNLSRGFIQQKRWL